MARLKTVELLVVLLKTKRDYVEEEFIRLEVVSVCLDLFFNYDMNNLLHILVEEIVNSCLVSSNTALIDNLFTACSLLDRLLAVTDIDSKDPPGSKPRRAGYFGHVTSISNKVVQAAETSAAVQAHTSNNPRWAAYVKATLAARNAVDTTVLGGNSPAKSPPRSDSAPDLADVQAIAPAPVPPPVEPPTVKYAADSSAAETEEGGTEAALERDPEFDARTFLAEDQTPSAPEDVWEEKQIVDLCAPTVEPTPPTTSVSELPDREALDDAFKEFNALNFWSLNLE